MVKSDLGFLGVPLPTGAAELLQQTDTAKAVIAARKLYHQAK